MHAWKKKTVDAKLGTGLFLAPLFLQHRHQLLRCRHWLISLVSLVPCPVLWHLIVACGLLPALFECQAIIVPLVNGGFHHLWLFCCSLFQSHSETGRKENWSQIFPGSWQSADTGSPCHSAAASKLLHWGSARPLFRPSALLWSVFDAFIFNLFKTICHEESLLTISICPS